MSQRAETDALTGLANHGAFQRDLSRFVEEAAAGGRAADRRLAVLMMDLDRFKAYNDRNGHPAGDALLHRAATTIYGAARSEDRVYRYGGDEFALILPGASVADAARVAQRIRRAVGALTAADPTQVTITVGVAGLPGDADDRAGLIAAADTALYYGKRAGEDRVVRADRLTPDVGDLRGTLEELASAALRDGDDQHAVEHLVERATQLSSSHHDGEDALRDALLTVARSFETSDAAARGHADRVGRLAADIAARVGLAVDDQRCVELAGRLHVLDEPGRGRSRGRSRRCGRCRSIIGAYRSLVADGAADRRVRSRAPVEAHIVGAATAYDELVAGVGRARPAERRRWRCSARRRRRPAAPTWSTRWPSWSPQRHDGGRRRRRTDAESAGGARRRLRYHPAADDDLPPRLAAPGRGGEPGRSRPPSLSRGARSDPSPTPRSRRLRWPRPRRPCPRRPPRRRRRPPRRRASRTSLTRSSRRSIPREAAGAPRSSPRSTSSR